MLLLTLSTQDRILNKLYYKLLAQVLNLQKHRPHTPSQLENHCRARGQSLDIPAGITGLDIPSGKKPLTGSTNHRDGW